MIIYTDYTFRSQHSLFFMFNMLIFCVWGVSEIISFIVFTFYYVYIYKICIINTHAHTYTYKYIYTYVLFMCVY